MLQKLRFYVKKIFKKSKQKVFMKYQSFQKRGKVSPNKTIKVSWRFKSKKKMYSIFTVHENSLNTDFVDKLHIFVTFVNKV